MKLIKLSLSISIGIAILAILASKTLFKTYPNHINSMFNPSDILYGIKTLSYSVIGCVYGHHHHHHHHHHRRPKPPPDTKRKISICDDFPKDMPPQDTNTTSYLCVDKNGCCNFTTVQSAIDAIGNFSQRRNVIWINTGMYYEKVVIPKTKPNITLQGQGFETTAIAWNDTAYSANGTFYCATVQVFGSQFVAKNISFMNVAPIPKPGDVGAQAVAIRITGDESAFVGCGFFGAQDTLHDDRGRHYFKDCYIQGSIDFIFGNAKSLYQDCRIISMANQVNPGSKAVNGAVTANGRSSKDENSGFSFVNCTIGGTGHVWLGRAWRPYSRVIFVSTTMTDVIAPEGWNNFNDPSRDSTIYYGEYNCTGPGAEMSKRASYVQKLNETQVGEFINTSYIDGDLWLQFSYL
ncbi:unnamed protein product [Cochlearia groenlandica]